MRKAISMMYNECTRYPLYRSRRGWLFGVCRGIAEYSGIAACWLRAALVIAIVFIGFWPVCALYLLAALLLKRAPRRATWLCEGR